MKRRTLYFGAGVVVLGVLAGVAALRRARATEVNPLDSATLAVPSNGTWIAGPGLVEPVSEKVKVGSELAGKLQSVLVDQGDHIRKGQVLAVLVNDDYHAAVLAARATLADKEASLQKIINGARQQERAQAFAAVQAAEADMNNALAETQRRQRLYLKGVVSREETENFENQYRVSNARYEEALQHYRLIDATARNEDVAMANAEVLLSHAELDEDDAKYQKTFIRSPIDGVILRRHHRAGETVTNSSTNPDPVFTIGDCEVLRVRVDVDESDVAKLQLGEHAYVMARAFGDHKFWGKVVQIGEELGPKNVQTDDPAEHVDKKILETLVQLDGGHPLPVGLRVDAYIQEPK